MHCLDAGFAPAFFRARPEEVAAAKANWERAQTGATIAKTTYTRVNNMFEQGVIAQQKRDEAQAQWRAADQLAQAARAQYDMAQKGARPEDKTAAAAQARQVGAVLTEAQIALAETKIAAPVAGQVSKIQIQPGELAPQGFPVITLVNLDDAWAVLQVREDEMAVFAMGMVQAEAQRRGIALVALATMGGRRQVLATMAPTTAWSVRWASFSTCVKVRSLEPMAWARVAS